MNLPEARRCVAWSVVFRPADPRQIAVEPDLEIRTAPQAGVVNWRHRSIDAAEVQRRLPAEVFISTTIIEGVPWLRSVGANPMADPAQVVAAVTSLSV